MSTPLKNDRFLRALRREPVDYTPVWLMRQAGRYLSEYQATRRRAGSFMALCKNPEFACEVTLQPLARFDLDAAIVFSDILTIPDAMGLGLRFVPGCGPVLSRPVRHESVIQSLYWPDVPDDLSYVMETIKTIKTALNQRVPLIGFSGSPWTLATYMVEGGSSKFFHHVKGLLYRRPDLLHVLLSGLAKTVTAYLNAQIQAGVDCVMLFDSWGGVLSSSAFRDFSLHYLTEIVAGLQPRAGEESVPVIVFTKGGGMWLESLVETGCDALSLDWQTDLAQARARVGHRVALQGNMDPALLLASPPRIRQGVKDILAAYGPYPGHVFNLGHGVTPDIPYHHVAVLVDAVHEYSQGDRAVTSKEGG